MKLQYLHVENLFSYKELSLDFRPYGNTRILISGANGAGKTSILNIISWILVGDVPKKIAPDEVIRLGTDEGLGTLCLEIDDSIVAITRHRGAKETVTINGTVYNKVKGEEVLKQLLGFDAKKFFQVGYLGSRIQGLFLESQPQVRIALLTEMLPELGRLDKARDNAAVASKTMREALIKHQTAVSMLSADLGRIKIGSSKDIVETIDKDLNHLKGLQDRYVEISERQKTINSYLPIITDLKHLDVEKEGKIEEINEAGEEIERLNTQMIKAQEEEEAARDYLSRVTEAAKRDAELFKEQIEIEKRISISQAERVEIDNKDQELADEMKKVWDVTSKNQCPISGISLPSKCLTAIDKMKGSYIDKVDNLTAIAARIDKQISIDRIALKLLSDTRLGLCVNIPWAERDLAKTQAQIHAINKDIDREHETIEKATSRLALIDGLILPLEVKIRAIARMYPECVEWANDILLTTTIKMGQMAKEIAQTETRIQNNKDWLVLTKEKKEQKEKEEQAIIEISRQLSISQYWEDGFPRLKFYLMEEIIGRLEALVNTYLQEMMPGCVVALRTQREAKSREGMIDGLDIQWQNRQGFWSRLTTASEGQARRIALSFFAALHSLICEGTGNRLGFLLLDEITENLDAEGQRMLVEMLDRYYLDKFILVISHDTDLISLFPHNIEVTIDTEGISHLQGEATNGE